MEMRYATLIPNQMIPVWISRFEQQAEDNDDNNNYDSMNKHGAQKAYYPKKIKPNNVTIKSISNQQDPYVYDHS